MDITKDIQPMTTFRNHSAEIMEHLRQTQRPVILTVNGKAAAVIQDAEAYQRLVDLAAGASAEEGMEHGRSYDAKEALAALRAEFDIPRAQRKNLADSIHARFAKFGGVDLPDIPREPIREPPDFSA